MKLVRKRPISHKKGNKSANFVSIYYLIVHLFYEVKNDFKAPLIVVEDLKRSGFFYETILTQLRKVIIERKMRKSHELTQNRFN